MIRILRNPEGAETGGGGASVATATASQPSASSDSSSPSTYTPSNPMEQMAMSLSGNLSTTGPEGDEKAQGQTGEGENTAPETEPVEDWAEEEARFLMGKGLKDLKNLPKNEDSQRLLKMYRDAESGINQFSQSNANATTRLSTIDSLLHAGDLQSLKDMGYDIPVETRTPEKMIQEIDHEFNSFSSEWNEFLAAIDNRLGQDVPPALVEVLTTAANRFKNRFQTKADVYNKELEMAQVEERVAKKYGLSKGEEGKSTKYQQLTDKATAHYTDLVQKAVAVGDLEGSKYLDYITKATNIGGPLNAVGVTLAKGFGSNPHTAEFLFKVGKGLHTLENMPSIISSERKKWEKEEALKRQSNGGVHGISPSSNPSNNGAAKTSALSAAMQNYMGVR